jgi:glycosyltransferase involved in cell wall biosynthesis
MDLSIIIPLYNEEESLPELHDWIVRVVSAMSVSYEIIFVDDGSNDTSWKVVEELKAKNTEVVKGIKFRRNYGKSAALQVGFQKSQGKVVITMDADMQDSPDEIPELYRMVVEDKWDVVSGWKKKRHDPLTKTIPSKFFNRVTRILSGIKLHDFNCGLKAYNQEVVKSVEVYGEMHRYIPVLAKQAGFKRITEKVVEHRARKYGVSKFGLERFINGFLDLSSVLFITKFGKKPMHFFGLWGTLMFIFGGGIVTWIIAEKLYKLAYHLPLRDVTNQPLFYIALLMIVIGVQLFLAGFIGELISRSSSDRNSYLIKEDI